MESLINVLSVIVLFLFATTFGGLILWGTWDSLHDVFPLIRDYGVPRELELWTAIKFSWLYGVIFGKVTPSSSSS